MLQTLFVEPVYNTFVFFLAHVPGADTGVAIILLTLLVRAIFYPLFTSSIRTQMAMQAVQPELNSITDRYKDDPMERSRRTAELFTRHHIRPFSMLFSVLLQVAIFITLSYVFYRLAPPTIHTNLLYSFVSAPSTVSEDFFGILNLVAVHNVFLALLAAALQYLAARLSFLRANATISTANIAPEKQQIQRMQQNMMQYLFPVIMAVTVFSMPAAMGLYISVNSALSIAQELILRRRPL